MQTHTKHSLGRARGPRINRSSLRKCERENVLCIIMKRESITSSLFRSPARICGCAFLFLALRTTMAIHEPRSACVSVSVRAESYSEFRNTVYEQPQTHSSNRDAQGRRQFRRRVDKLPPLPSYRGADSNYYTARDGRDTLFTRSFFSACATHRLNRIVLHSRVSAVLSTSQRRMYSRARRRYRDPW